MMRGAEFADLTAFLAIAEEQSFRRAAARLHMAPSSLSHSLRTLEERLGTRLFHRTTRSVALTEEGRRLQDRLAPAFQEIDSAVSETKERGEHPSGRLRLTAPRVGSQMVLAPILGNFLKENPAISVEVLIDETPIDSVAAGFDAGLRLMEQIDGGMTAVSIGSELRGIVVASPTYLTAAGRPETPDDLLHHRCLNFNLATGRVLAWEFTLGDKERAVSVPGPLTTNDPDLLIAAARDGAGLAYVTEGTVNELLSSGALVHVMEEWSCPFPGWALYYPSGRLLTPAMRAFLDHIAAAEIPPRASPQMGHPCCSAEL